MFGWMFFIFPMANKWDRVLCSLGLEFLILPIPTKWGSRCVFKPNCFLLLIVGSLKHCCPQMEGCVALLPDVCPLREDFWYIQLHEIHGKNTVYSYFVCTALWNHPHQASAVSVRMMNEFYLEFFPHYGQKYSPQTGFWFYAIYN